MPYDWPEHEKLHAVADRSHAVGEFVDWLRDSKDVVLCGPPHVHNFDCRDVDGWLTCGYNEGERSLFHYNIQELLAEFFDIDLEKLEKEKLAMLAEMRDASSRGY